MSENSMNTYIYILKRIIPMNKEQTLNYNALSNFLKFNQPVL